MLVKDSILRIGLVSDIAQHVGQQIKAYNYTYPKASVPNVSDTLSVDAI
jgi:hypothetical protein